MGTSVLMFTFVFILFFDPLPVTFNNDPGMEPKSQKDNKGPKARS